MSTVEKYKKALRKWLSQIYLEINDLKKRVDKLEKTK